MPISISPILRYVRSSLDVAKGRHNIADDTHVAPVNSWLHSIFSQVTIKSMYVSVMFVTPFSNNYRLAPRPKPYSFTVQKRTAVNVPPDCVVNGCHDHGWCM